MLAASTDTAAGEPCPSDWTALHEAATVGDAAGLQALLAAGASTEAVSADGLTPLHCAAMRGHLACVAALLAAGASLETADNGGRTALAQAALLGRAGCLTALLAAGANPEAADASGDTALVIAACLGQAACLEALLAAGASTEVTANSGDTALIIAASNGLVPCLEALLAGGASMDAVNQRAGMSALHCAVTVHQPAAVRCLVAAGADLAARDAQGRTPRELAEALGKPGLARLLQQLERAARAQKGVGGGAPALLLALQVGGQLGKSGTPSIPAVHLQPPQPSRTCCREVQRPAQQPAAASSAPALRSSGSRRRSIHGQAATGGGAG